MYGLCRKRIMRARPDIELSDGARQAAHILSTYGVILYEQSGKRQAQAGALSGQHLHLHQ